MGLIFFLQNVICQIFDIFYFLNDKLIKKILFLKKILVDYLIELFNVINYIYF